MHSVPDRPVALYARVSTEEQAERDTIQAQVDFLRRFCQLYRLTVAAEYLDEGVSGTVPLGERPAGQRLLADARDGRFGVVLVYRTDRLARRLTVLLAAYEELERVGVALRSATEPLDTSTAVGKFVFQLMGGLAELERSTIVERTSLGRDRVARSGRWVGGSVPYGYVTDAERRLLPSAVMTPLGPEADVVRQLFQRVAAGASLVGEAQRLTRAGVPAVTRYPNGRERVNPRGWGVSRLSKMLHNPGYALGAFLLDSRFGQVEIAAPPLVSPELFQRVAERLIQNRDLARKNAREYYALRGLVHCGVCGRRFAGKRQHGAGRIYRAYRCVGAVAPTELLPERRCRAPIIDADWLETAVWQDIRAFILNPGPALAEAQAQVRARLAQTVALEAERGRLLKRLAELDRGRETILQLVRRGRVALGEAEAQLDAVAAERAQVQAELDALRAQADLAAAVEAQVAEASALLATLHERLAELEAGGWEARRPWIERLVNRITVEWDPSLPPRQRKPTVVVEYVFGPPAQHPKAIDFTAPTMSENSYPYRLAVERRLAAR